ncbi:response regulator receiver protein [alpha proteobacterium BAL199]|jgi:two-component system, chemotaxis family, chemotaxis protein CheY|nr:response regulator receiver protein [alpha proteobacterium BAL199]
MSLILVIDDNEDLRAVIRRTLEAVGHQVLDAQDGRQGLKLLQQHAPQVMITDILMPTKEGLETIREAKALKPQLAIIAMSGGGSMDSRDLLRIAQEFGADIILEKPFRSATVRQAVEALVAKHGSNAPN